MDDVFSDERFSHVFSDPKFRKLPRKVEKIKVDKRFHSMFNDRSFKEKYHLDERGRELNLTSSHNLKKLYNLESESSENEEEKEIEKGDDDESDDDENEEEKEIGKGDDDESEDDENEDDKNEDDKNEDDDENEDDYNRDRYCKVDRFNEKGNCKTENLTEFSEASNSQPSKTKKVTHEIKRGMKRSNKETDEPNHELLSESSDEEDLKTAIFEQKAANKEAESEESSLSDDSSSDEESSESDSSDSVDDEEEIIHDWEEWGRDVEEIDEVTKRLAICNMDWSRITSDDIYTVFNSFKPACGFINSVKIYPSEFGKQRMEQENLFGPPELVEKTLGSDEEEEINNDEAMINREKLRQYELNKLKYYYAVVDCDSPETANSLCEQLNGMEFESSSIRLDIRFIPDELTFDEKPYSETNKALDQSKYKPMLFMNPALQQGNVQLTWDETDHRRRDVLKKAFSEKDNLEQDLQNYLASSSSESDEDIIESTQHEEGDLSRKERMAKYRSLLQSLENNEKSDENEYEMEITWEPGLEAKTEEIIKSKLESNSVPLTPFEEIVKKQKEKRKMRWKGKKLSKESESESSLSDDSQSSLVSSKKNKSRAFKEDEELSKEDKDKLANLSLMASDTANIEDMSERKKSRKWKNKFLKLKKESEEVIDVDDPRFSAMYTSPLFSIDPSHPNFKSRKGISSLVEAQQKKRNYSADVSSKNTSNVKRRREL